MTDEELLEIMYQNDKMKKALDKIADYDPAVVDGYTDEWTQAKAFGACQDIARAAIYDMIKREAL